MSQMFSMNLFIFFVTLFLVNTSSTPMWWTLLGWVTTVATVKMKVESGSRQSIMVYYIVQEFMGLVLLMSLSFNVLFFSLLVKGGVPPFHFWMLKVLRGVNFMGFAFLMTMQKFPYLMSLSLLMNLGFVYILLLSTWIPLLQSISSISSWSILFYLQTSSANLLLVTLFFSSGISFILCYVYLATSHFMMSYVNNMGLQTTPYELVCMLVGVPITFPFFVKLFIVFYICNSFFLIIFLSFSFFLSLVSGLSLLNFQSASYNFNSASFILFPLFVITALLFVAY